MAESIRNMKILIPFVLAFCGLIAAEGTCPAADDYKPGPDSMHRDGVPHGTVSKHKWESKIFADTVRDYWVYVPAQYKADKPACVMVFQDGGGYVSTNGTYRVPNVFDNLIARHE